MSATKSNSCCATGRKLSFWRWPDINSISFSQERRVLEKGEGEMSRNGKSARMDLRLDLSVRRGETAAGRSPGRSSTSSTSSSERSSSSGASSPSSCVSSEKEEGRSSSRSPEATSMVLVGCPRCLMYVMLSEDDPKCPKCKSTVLLDFLNHPNPSARNTCNH